LFKVIDYVEVRGEAGEGLLILDFESCSTKFGQGEDWDI
jgi:hypothetical protein